MPSATAPDFAAKAHDFSDLELAVLLSLVNNEHCIVQTASEAEDVLDDVTSELQWISSDTFGLDSIVVECSTETTLESFTSSLFPTLLGKRIDTGSESSVNDVNPIISSSSSPPRHHQIQHQQHRLSSGPTPTIPHVVIAKNLHLAPQIVQIQCLELLRTRRIYSKTNLHTLPKPFLFIPVLPIFQVPSKTRPSRSLSDAQSRTHQFIPLIPYLLDLFFFAHIHKGQDDDDFVYIDRSTAHRSPNHRHGQNNTVIHQAYMSPSSTPIMDGQTVEQLRESIRHVETDIEVSRYQWNIISFLRVHRAVRFSSLPLLSTPTSSGHNPRYPSHANKSGSSSGEVMLPVHGSCLSATAMQHVAQLATSLAPLHGLDFVTPALVALAARKCLFHRIVVVPRPEEERSIHWGSDREAVSAYLSSVTVDDVLDDVLEQVGVPA